MNPIKAMLVLIFSPLIRPLPRWERSEPVPFRVNPYLIRGEGGSKIPLSLSLYERERMFVVYPYFIMWE
jgi:hypothetical protein